MTSRNQPIETSLEQFEETLRRGLHTAYPAACKSYDDDAFTGSFWVPYSDTYASDGDEAIREDWPVLEDVPVAFFGCGGGWSDITPLAKDDIVLLVFCERSLVEWLASTGLIAISPNYLATHNESDAIAVAGLFPNGRDKPAHEKKARVLAHKDGNIKLILWPDGEFQLKAGKVRLGATDASRALALAAETKSALDLLKTHTNTVGTILGVPSIPSLPDPTSTKVFTDG